jgi:hypothetical protein
MASFRTETETFSGLLLVWSKVMLEILNPGLSPRRRFTLRKHLLVEIYSNSPTIECNAFLDDPQAAYSMAPLSVNSAKTPQAADAYGHPRYGLQGRRVPHELWRYGWRYATPETRVVPWQPARFWNESARSG